MSDEENRNKGSAIIAAAIVGAAIILSWGVSSDEPRYQLASSGDAVIRMDTDSGELIACNAQRCNRVRPPDRAMTLGPIGVEIRGSDERKALPPPANETR